MLMSVAVASSAAERWAAQNFANLEYPSSIERLRVRRVDDPATVEVLDIEVRSAPVFLVRRHRPPKPP